MIRRRYWCNNLAAAEHGIDSYRLLEAEFSVRIRFVSSVAFPIGPTCCRARSRWQLLRVGPFQNPVLQTRLLAPHKALDKLGHQQACPAACAHLKLFPSL